MLRFVRFAFLCVVAAHSISTRAAAQALPSDPALVTGELDNGLHYIIRKHDHPPGRAALWMHMHTGSLNETDPQRGLAHYLEHMAFNGSENFPPGSVVPLFQSLGMTFGRDQNAFTNFEQTTYQLSLPDVKPETLGKGLTFFSDVLGRLLLTPKEIDAERQIIQEERRRGLSGRQRVQDYILERIAPGSLYGQRDTIGTEQTIDSVKQEDFRAYYDKWYVASNATLMVVADADPAAIIALVKEKFGSLPKRPRPTPQSGGVKACERSFAIVTSDPEIRSEDLTISRVLPPRPPTTTKAQYRGDLVQAAGEAAVNRRLADKIAKGGTSYTSARVNSGTEANAIYTTELTGQAQPGKWKAALAELGLELQRARTYGITQHELDDVRKQMIAGAERAVETESTQQAQAFMGRMNRAVAEGEPILSAQQRLDLLKEFLPTLTVEEVSKRFAEEFDPKAVAFIAVLPAGADVPTEAQLLELGTQALTVKPEKDAEVAHATQLMSELPTPGSVAESTEHAATHIWSSWLSNNVRVHYRFMDERKNEVSVSIALIGGELLENATNRGITGAAQVAYARLATKKLSSTDIRELMTGKKVQVGGGGGGMGGRGGRRGGGGGGGADAVVLSINGSPEELETGFQLAYLLLTEPLIEAAAFEQFQTSTREGIEESLKNPMRLGMRTAMAAPYPDNEPRTAPLTVEQLEKLTLTDSQAWLDMLVQKSPMEVTIVGDIPKERAMELAAKYFGALPTRPKVSTTTLAEVRKLTRPTGPRRIEKTLETPTKQAFVLSGFYGTDESNVADARALTMAARILSTRMTKEVREDAQLVYSISAGSRAATTYPNFGVFSAGAPTEPGKVDALVAKLSAMYAAFAAEGPTADELDVAKKQMANTLAESMREPGFWAGNMSRSTFRGVNFDDVANEPEAFAGLTAEQIKAAFAKYYSRENEIVVVVRPVGEGAEK